MTPPFNIAAYILLPVYHCMRDKEKLEKFNDIVCRVIYAPFAIVFTAVFLVGAILMAPIAWVKAVYQNI